jgi:hypothetical protein
VNSDIINMLDRQSDTKKIETLALSEVEGSIGLSSSSQFSTSTSLSVKDQNLIDEETELWLEKFAILSLETYLESKINKIYE